MRKHLKTLCGCTLVALLWSATALWGAEEHEGGGLHLSGLLFATVNFLLFIYLLRRFAFDWVRERIRQRHDTVVQTLAEAQRAKEEAEALKREYEQRLKGLAEEEEKLRAQMFEIAEKERARMREEARRMAERIREEAQRLASREMEEARQILRQEVAQMAVEVAVRLVRERLSQADHNRFVKEFIGEVSHAGSRL
jgi:F-type H+-transporting ATPase subunit b